MHPDLVEFQSRPRQFRGNTHQHDIKLKLFAESSMDKIEHVTDFYLSDVPLNAIHVNAKNLVSATGKLGMVTGVDVNVRGRDIGIHLTIKWDGVYQSSEVLWPDECTNIKVDLGAYGHLRRVYVDYYIQKLERSKMFLERIAVKEYSVG